MKHIISLGIYIFSTELQYYTCLTKSWFMNSKRLNKGVKLAKCFHIWKDKNSQDEKLFWSKHAILDEILTLIAHWLGITLLSHTEHSRNAKHAYFLQDHDILKYNNFSVYCSRSHHCEQVFKIQWILCSSWIN